jgi:hypothetical protein
MREVDLFSLNYSRPNIDILAGATFYFLTADGKLQQNPAIETIVLFNLRCGHFVDAIALRALDLRRSCNKLKHAATLIADKVRAWQGSDPLCNTHVALGHMHDEMLV